jgi:hypothetical protein
MPRSRSDLPPGEHSVTARVGARPRRRVAVHRPERPHIVRAAVAVHRPEQPHIVRAVAAVHGADQSQVARDILAAHPGGPPGEVLPYANAGIAASLCAIVFSVLSAACGAAPVRAAAPSCPSAAIVVLASQADIARIAPCATLAGVVIRSGAALDTSVLRALTTITGDLVVGPTVGIHEVALGELRVVEGAIRVANNGLLQGLFLPKLERAGQIDIDGNVAVTTISLPRLADVRGALRITSNASLEVVDMPMLQTIANELVLAGAPELTLVDASQLTRAASVSLDAPKLPPELADRLRAAATTP